LPSGGLELQISGTAGNDRIVVVRTDSGLAITNSKGRWQDVVDDNGGTKYARLRINGNRGNDRLIVDSSVTLGAILNGAGGDDSLTGGAGNDSIYGGSGRDRVMAGAGDDTIVSLDIDHKERIAGGEGIDNFWVDAAAGEIITDLSPEEIAYHAEHRVVTFNTPPLVAGATNVAKTEPATAPVPRGLYGQDLPDPALPSTHLRYLGFHGQPLFAQPGPAADDVRQGSLADCYLTAPLSSLAAVDPQTIRQSIVELGDGTFGVRFFRPSGQEVYYRIDDDLPTLDWTFGDDGLPTADTNNPTPAFAGLGAEGSLWVALIEKAFAFYRRGEGTYASLNYGWMSELYGALGMASSGLYASDTAGVSDLLRQVDTLVAAGRSVTMGTISTPDTYAIVASHAYWVVDVKFNAAGEPTSLLLRNPWAIDSVSAPRDGVNDGYVTVTAAEAADNLLGFAYA
ncbi:MAG: C2 family cysteine protease, partial [Tepidisphaeraceae bacterium]